MKKIIAAVVGIFCLGNVSFSQDILITLQYKTAPDSFYVYMTPAFSDATFNVGTSQITVVFNSTFPVTGTGSVGITSVAAAAWAPTDYVQEPGGAQKKYLSFLTSGAPFGNITAGQKVLLFRFRVTGGDCLVGTSLRVFVNGTDPVDPAGT